MEWIIIYMYNLKVSVNKWISYKFNLPHKIYLSIIHNFDAFESLTQSWAFTVRWWLQYATLQLWWIHRTPTPNDCTVASNCCPYILFFQPAGSSQAQSRHRLRLQLRGTSSHFLTVFCWTQYIQCQCSQWGPCSQGNIYSRGSSRGNACVYAWWTSAPLFISKL